jgi:pSer/pThr/pTyr-binding forkhead associated (FHA) protein
MSKVNNSGFWRRIGSAFERSDIDDASGTSGSGEDAVRTTTTRYAPIREAVERRVQSFMRQDLVSHLEIGFNEIFLLHYVEISADKQGAAELEQFLREFPAESRINWVKKLLGPALGQRVSVEQFLGLDKEFSAEALAETDPFEEQLQHGVKPLYRVILHGRWESGVPETAQAPAQSSRLPGPTLRLAVQDAKEGEARVVEVEQFPAVLGSSVHADVEISGNYVSARHCTLHWDGELLWLADHSTNGTWIDGERVRRGQRVAVANGALLGFGRDRGEGAFDRYPAIRASLLRQPLAAGATATPVAPSGSTPVAPGIAPLEKPRSLRLVPLAVLAVVDASGSPRHEVLKLPFTIGRGTAQDYVVPDANLGVSREHLVIESIDRTGAVAVNRAVSRNGTYAGSDELPERFVWRFGEEIILGEKWTNAPVVRIALRQPEQAT